MRLLRLILLIVFCSIPTYSFAAAIYVGQSTSGSDTGASCANAHSAAWFNTSTNWGSVAGKINPGDTVHLCGTFTGSANSTMLTAQASGTSGAVTTLLFETGADFTAPYWSGSTGAISLAGRSYIKVDGGTNGVIENTANGTTASGKANHAASIGLYLSGGTNLEITNLTIKNIFINTGGNVSSATDSSGIDTRGIYGGNSNGNYTNINIHDNTITNSRSGILFDFDSITMTTVNIYNNTLADHGWQINVGAGNINSSVSGLNVYNNDISNWTLWQFPSASYHTDGLITYSNGASGTSVTGSFYNNYAHGDLGGGSPTAFIQVGGHVTNFQIFNNIFKCEGASAWGSCISVWNGGDVASSGTVFYNNTLYGFSGATGPSIAHQSGNALLIKNNIILNYQFGVFTYTADYSDVTADYNDYSGITKAIENNSGGTLTLAQFQASPYFQEAHGLSSAPNIDSTTFIPNSGSPLIGAALNLTSVGNTNLDSDKAGVARGSTGGWTIGALNTSTAINGACGTASGQTFSSLTSSSSNLCATGSVASFAGTGPWTWGCNGSGGGTSTAATACSASVDATPPVLSGGSPTGVLSSGTTTTTLSVTTDESATCKWSSTAGTSYASMAGTFTDSTTSHTTSVVGMSNGQSYTRYIRCQDTLGNTNASDYTVSWSIAGTPTAISNKASFNANIK